MMRQNTGIKNTLFRKFIKSKHIFKFSYKHIFPVQGSTWVNLFQFCLLIIDLLKIEGLSLPITGTKLAYANFPVQLKFRGLPVLS